MELSCTNVADVVVNDYTHGQTIPAGRFQATTNQSRPITAGWPRHQPAQGDRATRQVDTFSQYGRGYISLLALVTVHDCGLAPLVASDHLSNRL